MGPFTLLPMIDAALEHLAGYDKRVRTPSLFFETSVLSSQHPYHPLQATS